MKKTVLLLALSVVATPLVAQRYYNYTSSVEEQESLAERNARKVRLAAQIAEEQKQAGTAVYPSKVFGAEPQNYTGTVLGEPLEFTEKTTITSAFPASVADHVSMYSKRVLYYFFPCPDRKVTVKWVQYLDKVTKERNISENE